MHSWLHISARPAWFNPTQTQETHVYEAPSVGEINVKVINMNVNKRLNQEQLSFQIGGVEITGAETLDE